MVEILMLLLAISLIVLTSMYIVWRVYRHAFVCGRKIGREEGYRKMCKDRHDRFKDYFSERPY